MTEPETRTISDIEDLVTALYIQVSRLYDVQLAAFTMDHPEEGVELMRAHADGIIYTPEPALKGTD